MDGVGGGGEGSQTTGIAPLLLWLQRDGVLAVNGWLLAVYGGLIRFCGGVHDRRVVGVEATGRAARSASCGSALESASASARAGV